MQCLLNRGFTMMTDSMYYKVFSGSSTKMTVNIDTGAVVANARDLGFICNVRELDSLIRIMERTVPEDELLTHLINRRHAHDTDKCSPSDSANGSGTGSD